ncbi:tripartite tricarboxylate transporter substrate binding protein [Bradyrhizobium sp. NP1]|uniref:Bug family tripartite tricarboxylate transporter substrate binding protein n=1 Tax=Bradyrhizobium sp. NP1 TaxID=3049772 RepID=UPI0025A66BD4|nr:tripartite tricarboxylate transporter substrate binding protein [Bradyrhizobium sp. NP1]WJR75858.1 tripartite tricarboxylate transporter substrate binding protein [Bradyrhizobium sp. NP1]
MKGWICALGLATAAIFSSSPSCADNYPSRPITFIVPWGPGGGADQVARMASKLIEPELKVSVPVINMPGATGQTGLTKLVTSPADGYSIEVMTGDTFALFAAANPRFKLDQITPIAILIQQPSGFFASAKGPYQNWDEVQTTAATNELRMAVTGYGSPDDLSASYFRTRGFKFQEVAFAEPGMRYASVVGGQSELLYEQAGDIRSFIDGEQIKPVLFFSKKPVEGFEHVPYSGKLGYDVTLPQFRVVIVRAGTDPAIVKKLANAFAEVAKTKDYSNYLKLQYANADSYLGPEDSLQFMREWLSEADRLSKLNASAASPGVNSK